MSTAVSPDLRRMTSQPTITLSAPAPQQSKASPTTTARVPPSASANATPKQTTPGPLLASSGQSHAGPTRSQSIPSSPTSVHSSSSAIFERDIEPIGFQSSPLKNADPHHISRAQVHEPTEQAVPSVLTSAVSALSLSPSTPTSPSGGAHNKRRSIYDDGEISVISPAPALTSATSPGVGGASLMLSGMATPRSMSRSPSPPATATIASTSQSQHQQTVPGAASPTSILGGSTSRRSTSPRPLSDPIASSPPSSFKAAAALSGENPVDPADSGVQSSRVDSSPVAPPISGFVPGSGPIPRTRPSQASLVTTVGGAENFAADEALAGSPNHRLSFISYHDLLVSTPLSAAPLSSITSGVAQPEPLPATSASLSVSLSNSLPHPSLPSATSGHRSGTSSPSPPRGRPTAAHATVVGWGKEDGGEWEREGLGKGLEERLEEVLSAEKARSEQAQASSPTR